MRRVSDRGREFKTTLALVSTQYFLRLCLEFYWPWGTVGVPFIEKKTADIMSKVFDYDDLGVSIAFFRFVDGILVHIPLIDSQIVKIVYFRRFHPGSRRRVHPEFTRFPWIGLVITIG